jgi:hypothetical protein
MGSVLTLLQPWLLGYIVSCKYQRLNGGDSHQLPQLKAYLLVNLPSLLLEIDQTRQPARSLPTGEHRWFNGGDKLDWAMV